MSTGLLDLQKRMAAAVMAPLTGELTTRKRRADGAVMEREAAAFIKPNDRLTSLERLEIYNRQYWFRLFDSLEEDFPGLLAVLGRKQFERVTRAYLEACPSISYTLRDLGSRLCEFLAANPQLTAPRTTLALEVARLEWTHIEVYDAAQLPMPTPEFLASVSGETRFQLQPSLRLLELSYPVDDLLIAVRQGAGSSDFSTNNAVVQRRSRAVRRVANLDRAKLWLAVHRQDFTVFYKRLQVEEYRMLAAMQSGAPLEEVFAAAGFEDSTPDEERAAFLQQCFYQWSVLGWLAAPHQPSSSGDSQ
jgi:hypothetical protein